jgi:P27 family predicted phage terminase small subunit
LRVLYGEPQYRLNQMRHGPVPEQAGPVPPDVLNDEQRVLWDAVVEWLTKAGLGYRADSARLAALVYAEWLTQECVRRINETGTLIRGANGEPKQNPLLAVLQRADARATTLAREFGLTPAARGRLLPKVPDASLT